MYTRSFTAHIAMIALVFVALQVNAQPAPPYGAPISFEMAQRCMTGASAEATKNSWNVTITILDAGGHTVLMQRMDNVQFGTVAVAHEKAHTAVAFRRPSKAFEDMVVQGGAGLRLLGVPGVTPVEGGLPIVHEGRIIGSVGVSGATAQQDGQIAQACLNALQQ